MPSLARSAVICRNAGEAANYSRWYAADARLLRWPVDDARRGFCGR